MEIKRCTKCGEEKPLDEFSVTKRDGVLSQCKECLRQYARERYKKPEVKARMKEYYSRADVLERYRERYKHSDVQEREDGSIISARRLSNGCRNTCRNIISVRMLQNGNGIGGKFIEHDQKYKNELKNIAGSQK